MQEQHFDELKDQLSEVLYKIALNETFQRIRPKVAAILDKLNAEQKLLNLPPDEFQLLVDYRVWKASPDVVGGVFHWRKPERQAGSER